MLVSGCGLLCTHLWDPVPRFRRHPFSDYGLASVCMCVCVCTLLVSLGRLGINVHTLDLNLDFLHFLLQRRLGRRCPLLL